jgi:GTP:adenosylcobinamide-phosphate guanylyltransferase
MDVLVGAGGLVDAGDPMATRLPVGSPKVLLPLAGRPMVQWVLDAIAESRWLSRVFISGLLPEHDIRCAGKELHYLGRAANTVESVLVGCGAMQRAGTSSDQALWVAGDLPLIRAEMLDWFVEQMQRVDHDFYFPTIDHGVMHRRFPQAGRTAVRLKDGAFCIGDVYGVSISAALDDVHPFWSTLPSIRKSPLTIAARVGVWSLVQFATRQMTVSKALRLARERFGLDATVVECPWAEMGMDVDRPRHFDLVEAELSQPPRRNGGVVA